jgi:glycosyltransferase involved in cell wall biosynthesis
MPVNSDPPDPAILPPHRLRVLVFTLVFPRPGRPVHGTFVLERLRHLAALADVRVVCPLPWFERVRGGETLPDIKPILGASYPRFWYVPKTLWTLRGLFMFLAMVRTVARLRRTFDFDLIDVHFAYPDGFAGVLLGRWFRRPVCITLRGMIVPLSRRAIGRWLCNWPIRRAQQIIAVSANLADRARQGGVPDHRIATIGNGVDGERFRPMAMGEARRRLGLPEDGRLLVTVGFFSKRRGFHRVIRNLPRLLQSYPDLRYAVVGGRGFEEDNSAELYALVEQLGLSDRVAFVGAQPPERVTLWMNAGNLFVLPTEFEGSPNVVLEALACGRPIVATKAGDIAQVVPEFAGILVDDPDDDRALSDAILTALGRDWDTGRIRGHGAARSWNVVARQVLVRWQSAVDGFAADALDSRAAAAKPQPGGAMRSGEI